MCLQLKSMQVTHPVLRGPAYAGTQECPLREALQHFPKRRQGRKRRRRMPKFPYRSVWKLVPSLWSSHFNTTSAPSGFIGLVIQCHSQNHSVSCSAKDTFQTYKGHLCASQHESVLHLEAKSACEYGKRLKGSVLLCTCVSGWSLDASHRLNFQLLQALESSF